MLLGENLRRLRGNETQEKIAKSLNISRARYSHYENNRVQPDNELLDKMAELFEVSTDYLLGRKENINAIPVGERIHLPIIGTVKAGNDGIAYEEHLGYEWIEKDEAKSGEHFWLKVRGDSMNGDGILEGDLALIRKQEDVENGEIAVVVVGREEGTLKRVYKQDGGIVLQASNNKYPPRMFGEDKLHKVKIVGKMKQIKRKY